MEIKKETVAMKKIIAIIESNSEYQKMMLETLKRCDSYEVVSASDGLGGLSLVKSVKPDLVVLEIFLPGVNGFRLIGELKSDPSCRDIGFLLLLSAFEDECGSDFSANFGLYVNDHMVLRKPFNAGVFLKKVEDIFYGQRAEKAAKDMALIVDDDLLIYKLLRHVLRKGNFDTIWAENGKKGLEMIESHHPDIVLLDFMMPGMDGMEVLERALMIDPDLPVIIVSAQGSGKMMVRLMKSGAMDYISKPFDDDEIIAKTRDAMQRSRLKAAERCFFNYMVEVTNHLRHQETIKKDGLNEVDGARLDHDQKGEEIKKNGKEKKRSIRRKEIENVYNLLINYTKYIFAKAKRNDTFHLDEGLQIIDFIIRTPQAMDFLYGKALSLKTPTDILFTHSVNVSIYALIIGTAMQFDRSKLRQLGTAGLFHDIGMTRVPKEITSRQEKLTEEEIQMVKRHPQFGADILRRLGPDFPWLIEAVCQEHERENGKGYPAGLMGDQINEFARIIGVVDVYEALTSPRPKKKPVSPCDAAIEILKSQRGFFWTQAVKMLVECLSAFPVNSYVLLSSGAVAKVVEPNKTAPMNPKVIIFLNAKAEAQNNGEVVDLQKNPILHIIGSLAEEDLPSDKNSLKKIIKRHHLFFNDRDSRKKRKR